MSKSSGILKGIVCGVLVVVVAGGAVAIGSRAGWFDKKPDEPATPAVNVTAFDVDLDAVMELTDEDLGSCVPVTVGTFLGSSSSDDFAYIDLISYEEATETLVVVAHSEMLGCGIFVRSQGFKQEEVAKILQSTSIFNDYFMKYQYEAYLYVVEQKDESYAGSWINLSLMGIVQVFLGGSNDINLEEIAIPAPSATLKFDTKGTFKPTDNVMNALTGEQQ